MSTIVVVRKGDWACIAADTLTTFGETKQISRYDRYHDKIYPFAGNYLGIVGSAAHQLVIQSLLNERQAGHYRFDTCLNIFEALRDFHPILKKRYFLNPRDEEEDAYESSRIDALLVNPHGLFGIYALREVFEYTRFWAIGAGSEFALGALYALYERLDSAEAIAGAAIEAAAEFDTSTALPMTVYTVRLKAQDDESVAGRAEE